MTYDGRHDVTGRTLVTLSQVMHNQDNYGMDKYKQALKHTHNFDWLMMTLEELADALKYIQNEIDRREQVKKQLAYAIEIKDWEIVKVALENLSITGTGK